MTKKTKSTKNEVDAVLEGIKKKFGSDSIATLEGEVTPHPFVSTGSIGLDGALGIGGLPRGRITEIYGPESSGKTTMCLQTIAAAQAEGGKAAFIDAEHALDPKYARDLGVNLKELAFSQPSTGEEALEIVDMLVSSGEYAVVVVDSVAALTPKAELDGEMGQAHVGLQSRMMSQAMRKLAGKVSDTGTIVIFINQIRMKIGVTFGSPQTTTGGNALKFYSSVRLDIRRIGSVKQGENITGNRTRVKVIKNKMAPPFKQAEFDIIYGKGVSQAGELVELGIDSGVIDKKGAWYAYNGSNIAQGLQATVKTLESDPKLLKALKCDIKKVM